MVNKQIYPSIVLAVALAGMVFFWQDARAAKRVAEFALESTQDTVAFQQDRADSLEMVVEEQVAEMEELSLETDSIVRIVELRIDTLVSVIEVALPDTLRPVLDQLVAAHDEEVVALLTLGRVREAVMETLREEVATEQRINAGLRREIEILTIAGDKGGMLGLTEELVLIGTTVATFVWGR